MLRLVACLVLPMLWVAGTAFAEDPPEPTELLKTIDSAVFYYDHQPALYGYTAQAVTTGGDPKTAALGPVRLDPSTKAKTTVAWTPGCGPWTLSAMIGFEIELFAQPWSQRFGGDDWARRVEASATGWTLHLTPKTVIGTPGPLSPAINGLHVDVDAHGALRGATLDLDLQFMKATGTIGFEFDTVDKLKRIRRITHKLASANLEITPTLDFAFVAQKSVILLDHLTFTIQGRELSSVLGGAITSRLNLTKYALDKKPK